MGKKLISLIFMIIVIMSLFCTCSCVLADEDSQKDSLANADEIILTDMSNIEKPELDPEQGSSQNLDQNSEQGSSQNSGQGSGSELGPSDYETTKMLIKVTGWLALITAFACVIKLMQIGIMYMLTGASDKSQAKSAVLPWVVGTIVCGGYYAIGSAITGLLSGMATSKSNSVIPDISAETAITNIGQIVLGVIAYIAAAVAVGMIIYIGIRYFTRGAGGMAKAKTTLMPYIIGAFIVGGAATITQVVLNSVK